MELLTEKWFEDSSPLLAFPEQLREKAGQDGYLFLRGLLAPETLLRLRIQILEILQRRGLLQDGSSLMDGIADSDATNRLKGEESWPYSVPLDLYLEVQKLELFHAIAHDSAILNAMKMLFGATPFPHPKTIARIMIPHNDLKVTPPHQDFIHIQGTENTWTIWFPLGDCSRQLGGLSILEGSHKLGILHVTAHGGAGGLESILCSTGLPWAVGDLKMGDALIFNSHTVHKSLPNLSGRAVRLSCDFRYQPIHEIIDPRSFEPHVPNPWEEIYGDWENKELQYYWKRRDFEFSEWDESIHWQKEKIC